ncbi:MAG TPA: phosphoribosylamine--glycine ligase [Candidatus Saccharimonadales bacterium]|nr:phosphoribosylamine--glycine ligase [Candidatus Saccharimonadales bacterium]
MAKVLVIGSGGREQALAWKLAQSEKVDKVYVAPGNGGSQGIIENVDIGFTDGPALLDFAKRNGIELTVVGQEAASEAGVVDLFEKSGVRIFGPNQAAAKIETSKAFSKDLMAKTKIPTAAYKNFTDPAEAAAYAKSRPLPVVIKADGLATGKGVIIAETTEQIDEAIKEIMIDKAFGAAGNQVVVEDFLKGREASMHALSDGQQAVLFPPSQDHKQVNDGDEGPNTGGMGVIAPVDWITDWHMGEIKAKVVEPAIAGLKADGATFKGLLYPGLMIDGPDGNDIKVLEFNARFGDPECQVYMRLLDGDLYQILSDCADGKLDPSSVGWRPGFAVCVCLVSGGYPGDYQKGLPISGVEEASSQDGVVVFHAGTAIKDGQLVTAGGRVLNVTAVGNSLDEALGKAYEAIKSIHFDGMHYRTDIGHREG